MMRVQNYITSQTVNQIDSVELEQIWESNRLKTLKNWSMAKPSAKKMAEAGFYIPNEDTPDIVKCFSCFIELDGWEPTDDPCEEHKKRALVRNPKCKYIEIGKKESELEVDDFLEILKSVILRTVQKKCEMNINAVLLIHKKKKLALKKELQNMGIS